MVSILLTGPPESSDSRHSDTLRYLVVMVIIGATLLLVEELSSRAALVTVATVTALGVAVVVADRGGWLTWVFLSGCAATLGLNAARLYRLSTRPTLAGDPTALAVDERLRADDAVFAVRTLAPLTMIPFGPAMPRASQPNSWVWFCWMIGLLVLMTTWTWAGWKPRWPGSPTAGWDPNRDDATVGDPVYLPAAGPGAGPWSGGKGR